MMKDFAAFRCLVFAALVFVLAAPAAAQNVKIKMGAASSPPILDTITPYVAVEKGFFKKYGLDVEIVEFRGDVVATKAVLSNDIDVLLNVGATSAIVSASQGAKIRAWLVPHPVTPYHFVARKETGGTIRGLAGKTIAVSGIGAVSYHIPRIILERNGVDPEKVNYVVAGSNADRFRALISGKADAAMVSTIEAAKLDSFPDLVNLVVVAKVVPEIPFIFSIAREDYIQKNSETMYRLTKAVIETSRWIAVNKRGTVEVAALVIPDEKPEVLAKAYDLADPRLWGVNGEISEGAYKYTVDFLLKVGFMKEPIAYDKLFDRRFVDRALKELGRK
jgi:ABC-type nitrate/sulfonate/bicarbonate transport system substrate-binding protein